MLRSRKGGNAFFPPPKAEGICATSMKKFFLTVMSIFGILFMPMYIVQAGIEVSPPSFHLDILPRYP